MRRHVLTGHSAILYTSKGVLVDWQQLEESRDLISLLIIIKRLNTRSDAYHGVCVDLRKPRTLVYQVILDVLPRPG